MRRSGEESAETETIEGPWSSVISPCVPETLIAGVSRRIPYTIWTMTTNVKEIRYQHHISWLWTSATRHTASPPVIVVIVPTQWFRFHESFHQNTGEANVVSLQDFALYYATQYIQPKHPLQVCNLVSLGEGTLSINRILDAFSTRSATTGLGFRKLLLLVFLSSIMYTFMVFLFYNSPFRCLVSHSQMDQ